MPDVGSFTTFPPNISPLTGETGTSPSDSRDSRPSISSDRTRRLHIGKELGQKETRTTLERTFPSTTDYTDFCQA
ncbi:hypothetical protein scyTo_0004395 [Scyliorhinus torazame]|uniref:Uncharacterized protein n=1 Tax=Scyliorhinus torazame TaxID=75743 RepID=A0A401NR34_SCYTO|nr:hypothetical protein [Scyliorhinus torazame]